MADMNLAAESSSSIEELIRSMEDLAEKTLKLNKRIMEKYEEVLKDIEKHKLGSSKTLSQSMEDLAERTLTLNERIMEKYENILKVIEEHSLSIGNNFQIRDEIQKAVSAILSQIMERTFRIAGFQNAMNFEEEAIPAYNYVPYLEKIIIQIRKLSDIQFHMLSVLRQLGASLGPLVDTVNLIANSIGQLNTEKEVPGGEFGQLVTPVLQNAIAAMLVDTLASDGKKIWNIPIGKSLLTILLAIATVKLADSDDVISRLIGAPITAFLAGYHYTGSLTISLIIGGVVLGLNGATEIGKFLGDELIKYINDKWDMNLPSVKEMGMENYSIIDFVKMGFSSEGIQMQKDHPLIGLEIMKLVLFGPDFSWEKFWEEIRQNLFDGFIDIFGLSSPITQPSEKFGAGIMMGIITGFESKIDEFSQMLEDWIEIYVQPSFASVKWDKILCEIPGAFIGVFQVALEGVTDIIEKFVGLGEDAANGFIDGLTKQSAKLSNETSRFADIPIKAVRTTLDEHSPSRVMYQLGSFAIQGFKNGMESIYSPTLTSLEKFGGELQLVSATNSIENYNAAYLDSLEINKVYDTSDNGFIKSIEQSVCSAMKTVISESLQSKTDLPEIRVFIGNREITDVAIEGINERTIRNQKSPLI